MIVFDLEVRQFSVVDTREYANSTSGFLSNHKVGLINAGTTLAGAGIGTMIARNKAKKAAEARGLKPGTPEYKEFVRKQSLKGAAIGAGAGLITGVAGQAAHAGIDAGRQHEFVKVDKNHPGFGWYRPANFKDKLKVGWGAAKDQMKGSYANPVTGMFKKNK